MEKTDKGRKARAKNGERTQKMVAFRLDQENQRWLDLQANKGRYINQLIATDRLRKAHETIHLTK
jgi:hypothetical protein